MEFMVRTHRVYRLRQARGQQPGSGGTQSPTSPTLPPPQQQSVSPPPYSSSPPPAYLQCPSPPPSAPLRSPGGSSNGSAASASVGGAAGGPDLLLASGPSSQLLRLGPGQTRDPNWQASRVSVRERNAAMFRNELMSDVRFLVGPKGPQQQAVPAHRYVLATGSSVFHAMFYGGLAAPLGQDIEIPDVEPAAFLVLLRYALRTTAGLVFPARFLLPRFPLKSRSCCQAYRGLWEC